jgi:hypothetical protein
VRDRGTVVTARLLRIHAGRRVAWVAPAAAGAAVTIYLAWGAWVSAADRGWLHASAAWWRTALQPGDTRVPLIFAALWLLALLSYWWPRRLQPRVVGITTVVTMVVIGGVLTTSSLFPCRTGQTPGAVAGWVLDLYVGNPPSFPVGACHLPPALAYQLGGPVCVGATLTGAVTAAAVVWHQPVDRMRARLVRDATIFTGLDAMTMPLLERLAQTFRPASIVVIEPDASHPLLDQARATGAHVMIGEPSSPRVLLPVIAGSRGCALLRLYALRGDVTDNEAVLDAAQTVLRRYRPHPDRQPHLVARIDDPRHADHWRGWRIGRSGWTGWSAARRRPGLASRSAPAATDGRHRAARQAPEDRPGQYRLDPVGPHEVLGHIAQVNLGRGDGLAARRRPCTAAADPGRSAAWR